MNGTIAIPEGLRQQFIKLEKRLWRFDAIVAACGAVGSLLLSYALIFVSDRLWDTPGLVRLLITGAGVVSFGLFLYGYGRRWVWGDRSFPAMATLVQRRYRRLGDRLLGIVELADDHKRPANFSQALVTAAINQVADEASKVDFQQAVGTKRPRRYALGLVGACCVAALFVFIAPEAGLNAFWRWLQPMGDKGRYTFVNFDDLPKSLVVPHGEPFPLDVGVKAQSLLHPSQVTAQFERQEPTSAPVKSGVAHFVLAGQTDPIQLTLSAGDVSHSLTIQPEFRPELKEFTAHIEMPAYLQYPATDQKIEGGMLVYLKGSTVTVSGQATRGLNHANLEIAGKQTPLTINTDTFSTAPAKPEGIAQWMFNWQDRFGLDAVAPMKLRLQQKEDEPAHVDCRGMPGTVAILETEVVHVDVVADDDYGIQDVGVRWQTATAKSEKPSAPEDHKIATGAPQDKTVKAQYDFSPQLLHIPEGTAISFCATATDRFPGRPASVSSMHQIYILSTAAHAELIRQKLEEISSQFEELTRRQESLLDAVKTTRQQDASKLADPETAKKLEAQETEQKENAEQLQDLANKTADVLKEAGKNSDISPSTLQPWAKNAEAMNSLAQQSMPAAAQSLQSAQNSPNDRAPKLDKDAIPQEQAILDKMREMQNDMEKSMEKLMTQNLALRLRKIAANEKDISSNFQKLLPDIIGAKPEQLADEPKQALAGMTKIEDGSHKDSNKLQSEIARMFERTQEEKYGDVSNEMDKAGTDDSLGKLTQVIQDNISVQAIQSSSDWSKQFTAWADKLDTKDDSKSQDGDGKPGKPDMKALMALLHIREQQDEIRDRTGALENQKASDKDYTADAQDTDKQQGDVQSKVQDLQDDPDFPVPAEKLGRVAKAMGDAKKLLDKPDTGDATVADQTDALNLLDAIIMEQAKKSGQSMASLMAMMGMKPGNTPGKGYFGGGDTDRQNEHIAGTHTGEAADARHILQAGGNASAPLPAEFRDAIESYQHAVQQETP